MFDQLDRVAFDRLRVLTVRPGEGSPAWVAGTLGELSRVGVRVQDAAALHGNTFDVTALVKHVRTLRGEHGRYAPLFDGFPNKLPERDSLAVRAILAAIRLLDVPDPTGEQLRAAYDFTDINWWPASSVPQDVDATVVARARQSILPGDDRIEWWTVTVTDPGGRDARLRAWVQDALATPTSLREDVRGDLDIVLRTLGLDGLDLTNVPFRETRTLLAAIAWETSPDTLPAMRLTPDDLLRLFAQATGTNAALTGGVRFPKMTRAQRRVVINTLEASDRLADVYRRRGLWLAIGKHLHVGTANWAPNVQAMFTRLRATKRDRLTVTSRLEAAVNSGDLTGAFDLLVGEAPTLLVRNLRRLTALAVTAGQIPDLVAALDKVAGQVPLHVLLTTREQIADNGATYPRLAVTKAGKALTVNAPVGHLRVPANVREQVLGVLGRAITAQLTARDSWAGKTVHVAAGMDRVLVPTALRTTSAGVVQVERGSALPGGTANALRLFTHWKHPESDLDLSVIAFGDDFTLRDQVSWTHLRSGGIVHSGDITSAPVGAEEFIDIDLKYATEQARTNGWRYLAPTILRYSGPTFAALEEATVGWMLRDQVNRDRATFDPATVVNAFALTGAGRFALPFVYDLLTGDVLYIDLYMPGVPYAHVERDQATISNLVRAVVDRQRLRPTVAGLVAEHVTARGGTLVEDRETADITVGFDDTDTYCVPRPEKLLADLL